MSEQTSIQKVESKVVEVANIAKGATEADLATFFSFCGKLSNIDLHSAEDSKTQTATVTFEKPHAARKAVLLDQTKLIGYPSAPLDITLVPSTPDSPNILAHDDNHDQDVEVGHDIPEDYGTGARMASELLASGYDLADNTILALLKFDNQYKVAEKLRRYLTAFDKKVGASGAIKAGTDTVKSVDQSLHVSDKASSVFKTVASFFSNVAGSLQEQANKTALGREVAALYTEGEKTVNHVRAEGARLYELEHDGRKPGETLSLLTGTATDPATTINQPSIQQTQLLDA